MYSPCSKLIRDLFALPARLGGLGGLGRIKPVDTADHNFQSSMKLPTLLVNIMFTQDQTSLVDEIIITQLKKDRSSSNHHRSDENAKMIYNQMPPEMRHLVDRAKEGFFDVSFFFLTKCS